MELKMDIKFRDLIEIGDAAEKFKLDVNEIIFTALDGGIALYAMSKSDVSVEMYACKKQWIEPDEDIPVGFYIDSWNAQDVRVFDVELGQIIALTQVALKQLLINKSFNEVHLYPSDGGSLDDSDYDYWKTVYELGIRPDKEKYIEYNVNDIYVLRDECSNARLNGLSALESGKGQSSNASATSLKVIALLMHHLAKSPKFASGTTPNKSQIKELLLDLAAELDVNPYGLSKVDERLLADAMKYLESQKN